MRELQVSALRDTIATLLPDINYRIPALAVNVEVSPTHIAGLPVAVNLGCHSMRRATVSLTDS